MDCYKCCNPLPQGRSVMLLCSCVVSFCSDCANSHPNSYQSHITCPLCGTQDISEDSTIHGKGNAKEAEEVLVRAAIHDYDGDTSLSDPNISYAKLQTCLIKLRQLEDLNPGNVVADFQLNKTHYKRAHSEEDEDGHTSKQPRFGNDTTSIHNYVPRLCIYCIL